MATVHIRINGRDYDIACDDGQEDHLSYLADEVDDRVRSLVFRMRSNPGEAMALLLTGLMMADEVIENKREIEDLTLEVERLHAALNQQQDSQQTAMGQERMAQIENAMSETIDEIALRIEKIAEKIEIG
jgi:cell division protein ZapA